MKKSHKFASALFALSLLGASIYFVQSHKKSTNNQQVSTEKVVLSSESRKNLDIAWGKYLNFTERTLTQTKASQVNEKIFKKLEDRYRGVEQRAEKDEAYKIGLLVSIKLLNRDGNELKLFKSESKIIHLTKLLGERESSLASLKEGKAEEKVIASKEREIARIKEVLSILKN